MQWRAWWLAARCGRDAPRAARTGSRSRDSAIFTAAASLRLKERRCRAGCGLLQRSRWNARRPESAVAERGAADPRLDAGVRSNSVPAAVESWRCGVAQRSRRCGPCRCPEPRRCARCSPPIRWSRRRMTTWWRRGLTTRQWARPRSREAARRGRWQESRARRDEARPHRTLRLQRCRRCHRSGATPRRRCPGRPPPPAVHRLRRVRRTASRTFAKHPSTADPLAASTIFLGPFHCSHTTTASPRSSTAGRGCSSTAPAGAESDARAPPRFPWRRRPRRLRRGLRSSEVSLRFRAPTTS